MPIDQTGIPVLTNLKGGPEDNQVAITGAQTPQVSISAIVAALLAASTSNLKIVIDPQRRIIFANNEWNPSATIGADAAVKKAVFKPVAGSVGRAVRWEEESREAGFDAAVGDAIKETVDPVRPTRSLSTMLSAAIASLPDGADPLIVIDQTAGKVEVWDNFDDRGAINDNIDALTADFETSGDSIDAAVVELSEPAEESGAESQKFEGGAF